MSLARMLRRSVQRAFDSNTLRRGIGIAPAEVAREERPAALRLVEQTASFKKHGFTRESIAAPGARIALARTHRRPASSSRACTRNTRMHECIFMMERPAPQAACSWVVHDVVNGATYGEEPAVSSVSHRGFTHLGMDVSKDSISVAVLEPDRDQAPVDKIFHDEVSVRRLIGRVDDRSKLWVCYEAGPTGYDLYRLLCSLGVCCDVVGLLLVPKRRGDRVKTDRRDVRRLAGLHRAGELTPIGVPSPPQEAVRDLCRTRGDMVEDLTRARNRLTEFCCGTLECGATDRTGPSSISAGSPRSTSTTGPWPRAVRVLPGHARVARDEPRRGRGRPGRLSRPAAVR